MLYCVLSCCGCFDESVVVFADCLLGEAFAYFPCGAGEFTAGCERLVECLDDVVYIVAIDDKWREEFDDIHVVACGLCKDVMVFEEWDEDGLREK